MKETHLINDTENWMIKKELREGNGLCGIQ